MNRRGAMLLGLGCILSVALATPAAAGDAEKGKSIYLARCSFCHGESGKGDGPAGAHIQPHPKDLTAAEFWKDATPASIRAAIENGRPNTAMVAFKGSLTAEQLDDLVAYLQTFKP